MWTRWRRALTASSSGRRWDGFSSAWSEAGTGLLPCGMYPVGRVCGAEPRDRAGAAGERNRGACSGAAGVLRRVACACGAARRCAELARRNIDAMLALEVDAIITNAAGCGSVMKEYDDLLSADSENKGRAQQFRDKVRDMSEFLPRSACSRWTDRCARASPTRTRAICCTGSKIKWQPRELLRQAGAEADGDSAPGPVLRQRGKLQHHGDGALDAGAGAKDGGHQHG